MTVLSSRDVLCTPQDVLQTLVKLAPGLPPEQLAAVALHVASASSARCVDPADKKP